MADDESTGGGAVSSVGSGSGWELVAQHGPLVLGRSATELAVYDHTTVYGRWPLSEENHRYARQMFEAYAHSPNAGLAYAATGHRNPEHVGLPSDPALKSISYAAPLSFVGSARRIFGWASGMAKRTGAPAVLLWAMATVATAVAWMFVLGWYVVIFGLFGIFTLPYRLVRRSQRKNLHVQRTSLATQQAMLQQMAAMQQGAAGPMGPYPGAGAPPPGVMGGGGQQPAVPPGQPRHPGR
jgi:hypothetical protein